MEPPPHQAAEEEGRELYPEGVPTHRAAVHAGEDLLSRLDGQVRRQAEPSGAAVRLQKASSGHGRS
eukprot:7493642-Lingulodinium_polyedra.AAC.1